MNIRASVHQFIDLHLQSTSLKMLFKVFFVVLAAVSLAAAVRVNFRPCPGGHSTPLWVESESCTATRCTLTRGQVWTGRAAFNPAETFNMLGVDLSATFLGIVFPIDIPAGYEDACNFLEAGARCPVQPGSEYVWAIQAPVNSTYPAASNVVLQRKSTFPSIEGWIFTSFSLAVSAGEGTRKVACAQVDADIR